MVWWWLLQSEWALERQALAGESGKALSEALDKASMRGERAMGRPPPWSWLGEHEARQPVAPV